MTLSINLTEYAVFANGNFCGVYIAQEENAAIQMCADDVGTEGNTEGMHAYPVADIPAEWMQV